MACYQKITCEFHVVRMMTASYKKKTWVVAEVRSTDNLLVY